MAAPELVAVARFLRDDLRFDHLSNLSSIDWSHYPGYAGTERFTTVYHLLATRPASASG